MPLFAASLCDLRHLISSSASGLRFTLGSPGSQAFGLRLIYTTGYPGLQLADSRWQMADGRTFQPP